MLRFRRATPDCVDLLSEYSLNESSLKTGMEYDWRTLVKQMEDETKWFSDEALLLGERYVNSVVRRADVQ
jgi:hypothetical protein